MGHRCDPHFAVLHALRLRGFAGAATVAEMTGLPPRTAGDHLAAAGQRGLAHHRQWRVTGWSLTAEGRDEVTGLLAEELAMTGAQETVARVYAAFGEVNRRCQQVCTDWQLRLAGAHHVPNEHDVPAYDDAVIAALGEVDDAVQPLCATLGASLERMARYGSRLAGARERVEAGDHDRFTRPLANSYHDIWMELHEDLLVSLQRSRTGVDA